MNLITGPTAVRTCVSGWPAACAAPRIVCMEGCQEDDPPCPTHGHHARSLTEEEAGRLRSDTALVSPFQREKLEREAKKNWDLFYKRNTTHFFKVVHMCAMFGYKPPKLYSISCADEPCVMAFLCIPFHHQVCQSLRMPAGSTLDHT